uniref:NADH dehydrogenase subunit 6 n=1 Tax=Subparmatus marinkellei TaxID=1442168 RepID=W0FDQ2_9ACAR|nr:NADH dehydrogenase subunit 6 [Subparmatus marinkellei]
MKLIIMSILCFMSSSHPILMIMFMIITLLTLNMYMYMYMKFSWFILMVTLLILGGLLVIFLYITSLTPNKKFNFKKIIFISPLVPFINMNSKMNPSNPSQMEILFTSKSLIMLIFTLIYLMLTLISITTLIKSSMAPIKSN